MDLKLYNKLAEELLGDVRDELGDGRIQSAIEDYRVRDSGLKKGAGANFKKIQKWLDDYNEKYMRPKGQAFRLRYYQILALHFAETVLERQREQQPGYADRRMLAYWMATGSGKTLVMHLNILQYLDHISPFDELEIILTTPGVNLIEQHRRELEPFVAELNRAHGNRVNLTIETTQALLRKERGYFNLPDHDRVHRLVLVDEGHIGLSSTEEGKFLQLRRELCNGNSFLFEYSATYHGLNQTLEKEYEDLIVYEYNYYRFFMDGYGKDYSIQTISPNMLERFEERDNFFRNFSTFAEKLRIYDDLKFETANGRDNLPWEVSRFPDKPLLAFMGNTVADPANEGKEDEIADVKKVVYFLANMNYAERRRVGVVFHSEFEGRLTLTRSPSVEDEILLSYGDGEFWGIVNVGNGEKFFKDCEQLENDNGEPLVELRTDKIRDERYLFSNIDEAQSPINVLLGSRKFSEGWNCYRLSVIGLVNLGKSKGNKIIQIFGRGVRLTGLNGDGKRKHPDHNADYSKLGESESDRIRKLETLNVFSLHPTYLKTFTDALEKEIPFTTQIHYEVSPAVIKLGGGTQVKFEEYAPKLKIFKIGRNNNDHAVDICLNEDGVVWSYLTEDGKEESNTMPQFNPVVDLRSDKSEADFNILGAIHKHNSTFGVFLDEARLKTKLKDALLKQGIRCFVNDKNNGKRLAEPQDILQIPQDVLYSEGLNNAPELEVLQRLNETLIAQIVRKLHDKVQYDINRRTYRFNESLQQETSEEEGDFIYRYTVTRSFASREAKEEFEKNWEEEKDKLRQQLVLEKDDIHVYQPLFNESKDGDTRISPDALNAGECKLVKDLTEHVQQNYSNYENCEFYLMRNVESLRSIGVYLPDETRLFFPDFILWMIDNDNDFVRIVLLDPKGQTGLNNWGTGDFNSKVKIARKDDEYPQLKNLEASLSERHAPTKFCVDSFVLLRKDSPLGRNASRNAEQKKVVENFLLPNNILRLDWHRLDEQGQQRYYPPEKDTYLDMIFKDFHNV